MEALRLQPSDATKHVHADQPGGCHVQGCIVLIFHWTE